MVVVWLIIFVIYFLIRAIPYLSRNKEKFVPVYSQPVNSNDLLKVKVQYVLDGDTVIVLSSGNKIKIRLDSIDCPEDGQHGGVPAKFALVRLIGGRDVYLETHGLDIYGRTLATIYVNNKSGLMNVNERMIMLGHAWVMYMYYAHLSKDRQEQLHRLEKWARFKKVGLWKSENPIPPWEWRNHQSYKKASGS